MPFLLMVLLVAQQAPIFQSRITLVKVDAEAAQGAVPVTDLKAEDFRVTDNGKPQTIVHFGHEDEALDVILVFDDRPEIRPVFDRVGQAAHTALSDLRKGDRLAIVTVGSANGRCKTDTVSDFDTDIENSERAIVTQVLQREPYPGNLNCGVRAGLEGAAQIFHRESSRDRRRAIVIITDDRGTSLKPEAVEKTVRDLWQTDAVVLGVVVRTGAVAIGIGAPYRGVKYFAGKTGGVSIDAPDAALALQEAVRRLRLRYSLYYALPQGKPGEQRTIQVRLTPDAAKRYPQAVIRARTGYVMPSAN
jgi:VWFA-related protein